MTLFHRIIRYQVNKTASRINMDLPAQQNRIARPQRINLTGKFFLPKCAQYLVEPKRSQTIAFLLNKESQNEHPPTSGFNNIRGFFPIPFRTAEYKNWVSNHAGPKESFSEYILKHF